MSESSARSIETENSKTTTQPTNQPTTHQSAGDFFYDSVNADPAHGGQRLATMLMYLSTPEEGGETTFPHAEARSSGPGWSDCALQGLSVKAVKGNAILFFSLHHNGTVDEASVHGACPVTKGVKYSAPKWMHVSAFEPASSLPVAPRGGGAGGCRDADARCAAWAREGECAKNPAFMLSSCVAACGKCPPTAGEYALGRKGVVPRVRAR